MPDKRHHIPNEYCAIIPTYNNAATVGEVVEQTLEQIADVWVVDDGSTDSTAQILSRFGNRIRVITFTRNSGKGAALKAGFRAALKAGFRYAVTLDSDGQHLASDIPLLVKASQAHPGAAIIGSRNLTNVGINRKSSFANRFSNFWFAVQTFHRLNDTQTGFRIYPLEAVCRALPPSNRYEAELAMIVLMSWHGVRLIEQPINVYYPPASERVSHFKPARDFARISLLNTVLCFLAVVYGLPLAIWRGIRRLFRSKLPGRILRTFIAATGFTLYSILIFTPVVFIGNVFRRTALSRISFIHRCIWRSARLGARLLPGTRFVTLNPCDVDFSRTDRGMIAVCNHQSYLDLLALMRLSPRLVFVANARISSNHFFSATFNNGGNCTTANGFEAVKERVGLLINHGFTVVVFPEGTRSGDTRIGRWHIGAFELAKSADADIVPLTIAGSGRVLGKRDRLLGKGVITVAIGCSKKPEADETPRQTAKRMRAECITKLNELEHEQ